MTEDDILKAADLITSRSGVDQMRRKVEEVEAIRASASRTYSHAGALVVYVELEDGTLIGSVHPIPIDIIRLGLHRMAEEITRQLKEIT